MIFSVFTDRLGNNLFQFATALSIDDNVTICVPDHHEFLETIKYKDIFFKNVKVINYIPENVNRYKETSFKYEAIPYNDNSDLVLEGYFQSYKYIDREKILKHFRSEKSVRYKINSLYPDLLLSEFTVIHVRRGDYLKVLYKHPFCGLNYYKEAIKRIGINSKFVVISDDVRWCKKNIKAKNIEYIENSTAVIDFFIMTLSKNLIISNSSFSYWGAYLNEKKERVIAPSLWFGFRHNVDISDLLLPEYEIINNGYSIVSYAIAWFQFIWDHLNFKVRNYFQKRRALQDFNQ